MKKFTMIILALVLVFAMSTTAFAEVGVGEDGTGETKVNVEVDSSNISVTVPLSFTLVAKVDGGEASVPTNYMIRNNSRIPVKVDTIAVALSNGEKWAFKDTAIAEKTAPVNAGKNEIYLSVNGQVMAVHGAAAPANKTSWNVPAHNGTTEGGLSLPLVASTSRLNQTTTETNLITITYVISAGSH